MKIAATIDLEEAARRRWDAVVVGAGPAGTLLARELGRQGLGVLLVDKAAFPRPKVCGACLNGSAVAILGAVGLGAMLPGLGAVPLSGFCLAAGRREIMLSLNGSLALSREALDAALVRAALAVGVEFCPETFATDGDLKVENNRKEESRIVVLRRGDRTVRVRAAVVLACDGLGSRMAAEGLPEATVVAKRSWIGAGLALPAPGQMFYRSGLVHMAVNTGGYVGLVRIEDGRLNLAAALDPRAIKSHGGIGPLAAWVLSQTGWPEVDGMAEAIWRGTPALTRGLTRRATARLLVLGDAAGYVEPFTGEGMAWAMLQAVSLAPLAACAARAWEPGLIAEWQGQYAKLMDGRLRDCRRLTRLLHHPHLARGLVGLMALCPWLARPLMERFSWPPDHLEEAA